MSHWRVWTGSQMAIDATLPRFQLIFKLAKQEGFLDLDFVRFFERLLEGKSVQDPIIPAGHTSPTGCLGRLRLPAFCLKMGRSAFESRDT